KTPESGVGNGHEFLSNFAGRGVNGAVTQTLVCVTHGQESPRCVNQMRTSLDTGVRSARAATSPAGPVRAPAVARPAIATDDVGDVFAATARRTRSWLSGVLLGSCLPCSPSLAVRRVRWP